MALKKNDHNKHEMLAQLHLFTVRVFLLIPGHVTRAHSVFGQSEQLLIFRTQHRTNEQGLILINSISNVCVI